MEYKMREDGTAGVPSSHYFYASTGSMTVSIPQL